ncbi:Pre-mRNA-splicing factor sap61 [Microbotryomycetes sp. JL221]|nr:Pre-mRNA-splicing factor sap61 [Microbotryomycetes sp. JL221]
MSTSIIEDSRQQAEDVDLYERELTRLLVSLDQPGRTHRDKLSTSHRASDLVNRITHRSDTLLASLSPDNDERTREIDALAGGATSGGDLAEFYQRLAKIKEYHRKYPNVTNVRTGGDREVDWAALEAGDDEWLDKKFTGEEGLGRYLDLHEMHERWNNLAPSSSSGSSSAGGWKRLTYLQYLAAVTEFELSTALKSTPEYSKYLVSLLSYVQSFYERVFPLGDVDEVLKSAEAKFAQDWEAGSVPGWEAAVDSKSKDKEDKAEGIWCAACQKMYAKETVYNAHLTSKKHVKAAAKLAGEGGTGAAAPDSASVYDDASALANMRRNKNRALALKEALISAFLSTKTDPPGPLSTILTDTLSNTERRLALTDKERQTEIEELEAREAAEAAAAAAAAQAKNPEQEQDDEEERIYNPLKLPLGWDGKPIPYWLYKLHGLGVEYKCEICSDYIYMGRKAFERHFQESRHAFGMRALGLPNTKHFYEITKIEDAIALAEKLKQEGKQQMLQQETMEELEDDEGNVYDKKTYADLKRQGLI